MTEHRFFRGGELPSAYVADWRVIVLNTDFRCWLEYERLITADMPEREKAERCLEAVIDSSPPDTDADDLIRATHWFYSCGDSERVSALDIPPNIARSLAEKKPNTSLYWDFWQVWASFKQQHGIDLYDADMHWWEFKRLLGELRDNTPFRWLERFRSLTVDDFKGHDGKMTARGRKDWDETKVEQVYRALPGAGVIEE